MEEIEFYIKEWVGYPMDMGMSYLDFNISDKDRDDILTRFEKYEKERNRLTQIISKKFTKNDIKKFKSLNNSDGQKFVSDKVFEIFSNPITRPKTYFFTEEGETYEYKGPSISIVSEQPKKLKIGVKRINETETAIKNQEKTIKSKKKQILNEQEYLNDIGSIKFKWF